MLTKEDILKYLDEIRPELEQDGITNFGLFGSYAKGTADICSDVDIFVELTDEFMDKYSDFKAYGYLGELQEKLTHQFKRHVDICDITCMDKNERNRLLCHAIRIGSDIGSELQEELPEIETQNRNIQRLEKLYEKINIILEICENGVSQALDDDLLARPAILMHLIVCNQLLQKLQDNGYNIHNILTTQDIKGIYGAGNNISLGIDNVDLLLIEEIIRNYLPQIQANLKAFLDKEDQKA